VWLTLVIVAQAQLGSRESECVALWGESASAVDGKGGIRTVVFSNTTLQVEVGFVDGMAQRVVYHDLQMEAQDIPAILAANAAGQTWSRWNVPQSVEQSGTTRRWMRSDEMAMASFENRSMTVMGGDWNRAQQQSVAPAGDEGETGNETPRGAPAGAVSVTTNAVAETAPAALPSVVAPKAPRPEVVPMSGDTRVTALRILGQPPGVLRHGNREILSYPWGYVCLTNGRVVSVD
jgi:hypothetical protein